MITSIENVTHEPDPVDRLGHPCSNEHRGRLGAAGPLPTVEETREATEGHRQTTL